MNYSYQRIPFYTEKGEELAEKRERERERGERERASLRAYRMEHIVSYTSK